MTTTDDKTVLERYEQRLVDMLAEANDEEAEWILERICEVQEARKGAQQ